MESQKFQLNKQDMLKVGKGAVIAVSGAFLTYFLQVLPNIDFGSLTPLVVAGLSILVNFGLKFVSTEKA